MTKRHTDPNADGQHPNHFLDALLDRLGLKNDAQLARHLKVTPPVISKIRHLHLTVSPSFLLKTYDATGVSIDDLRALLHPAKDHAPA